MANDMRIDCLPPTRKRSCWTPEYWLPDAEDMIANLLRDETLVTDVLCNSWTDAVDAAGGPLVADGTISAGYLDAAKAAVHEHGAYMVLLDRIALFHARPDDNVHRVGLSLAMLREPVDMLGTPVQAAFLLAAVDDESHVELMRELAQGLMDEQFVELIRSGAPRDVVLQEVQKLESNS